MKTLLKQFPEIHHLPPEEQRQLLQQAQEELNRSDNKLANWRNNLLRFALVAALCLGLVWLGPRLGLSEGATAAGMLLVVLPLLFYLQHRRYIAQLRPLVKNLAKKKAAP